MHLLPILKAISRRKVSATLIGLEVAFSVVILLNALTMSKFYASAALPPPHVDWTNRWVVTVGHHGPARLGLDVAARANQDLEFLRSLPWVHHAGAVSVVPLGEMRSVVALWSAERPGDVVTARVVEALGDFQQGLGMQRVEAFPGQNAGKEQRGVLVSRALSERLFPGRDSLGQHLQLSTSAEHLAVAGLVDPLEQYPGLSHVGHVVFRAGLPGDLTQWSYVLHTRHAPLGQDWQDLQRGMTSLYPHRVIREEALQAVAHTAGGIARGMVAVLLLVMGLVLLVSCLGVVSITSFSVAERTQQIGIRRALGATRGDIVRLFLTENLLLIIPGMVLGSLGALALARVQSQDLVVEPLSLLEWVLCLGLVSALGQLSALVPALKAAQVPPVAATRSP